MILYSILAIYRENQRNLYFDVDTSEKYMYNYNIAENYISKRKDVINYEKTISKFIFKRIDAVYVVA